VEIVKIPVKVVQPAHNIQITMSIEEAEILLGLLWSGVSASGPAAPTLSKLSQGLQHLGVSAVAWIAATVDAEVREDKINTAPCKWVFLTKGFTHSYGLAGAEKCSYKYTPTSKQLSI
jgi:hypothetical protein